MNNLNITKTGYVVGVLSAAFFLVCMFWGALLFSAELKDLHLKLLQIAYPGFTMTLVGAVIGIIEAFVYGWLFGVLFAWLCRKICVSK